MTSSARKTIGLIYQADTGRPHDHSYAIRGTRSLGRRLPFYTIKKDLEATVGHFWNESYGQLYPVLKHMVDAGWVALQEADSKRNRKLYAITPAGYQTLQEWLIDPSEYMPPPRNELLLKLFFGRHLPKAHSLTRLRRYSQQLRATLAMYEAIEQELAGPEAADESQPYWLATLRNGQFGIKAALRWCSDARSLLEAAPESGGHSPRDVSRQSET